MKLYNGFKKSNSRSTKVYKNIIQILLLRGGSFFLSLVLIKVVYDYLGGEEAGIWLTIYSVLTWVLLLDIGIGNGLRNKLTESLARNDRVSAKIYVSTAYSILFFLVVIFVLIFLVANFIVDWNVVFNYEFNSTTKIMLLILGLTVIINLLLSLINNITAAFQETSISSLIALIVSTLFVGLILILSKYTDTGSIDNVGYLYIISLLGVMISANILLLFRRYKDVAPNIKYIKFNKSKDILDLGVKFFLIQVSFIVIHLSASFIIVHIMPSEEVVSYQTLYRLFSIVTILHSILSTPLWSAYTDAVVKNDWNWIRNTLKKMYKLLIPILVVIVLLAASTPFILKVWMGEGISTNWLILLCFSIYTFLLVWNNIFAYFLNGIGKVNIQLYFALLGAVVNIPISIYLGSKIGVSGVVIGSIIALIPSGVAMYLQTKKILSENMEGIVDG